jgi:light-regulated signal transduction histidine kinase (bacteriophytochrome)
VRATLAFLITETGGVIVWKPLPSIEADPILLEQLFRNLIGSALQYRRQQTSPETTGSCRKTYRAGNSC